MDFKLEKFLAITAVLAGVGVAACTVVQESDDDDNTGGTGGTTATGGTGGTAATGGTGGTAGTAGTGGTSGGAGEAGSGGAAGTAGSGGAAGEAGSGGAAGEAGSGGAAGMAGSGGAAGMAGSGGAAGMAGSGGAAGAAGATCLDDDSGDPGNEPCEGLPYANTDCDPGNYVSPFGYTLCWHMDGRLRLGVMDALVTCLADVPNTAADECSSEHDDAVMDCYLDTLEASCDQTEAAATCTTITTGCNAIDQTSCELTLNGYTPDAHAAILTCIADASQSSSDACDDIVANCIWETYYYL